MLSGLAGCILQYTGWDLRLSSTVRRRCCLDSLVSWGCQLRSTVGQGDWLARCPAQAGWWAGLCGCPEPLVGLLFSRDWTPRLAVRRGCEFSSPSESGREAGSAYSAACWLRTASGGMPPALPGQRRTPARLCRQTAPRAGLSARLPCEDCGRPPSECWLLITSSRPYKPEAYKSGACFAHHEEKSGLNMKPRQRKVSLDMKRKK
ncbi:uncharacterized protein LOC116663695 isoform X2 [Camelus ferus]|uniref:Uncharacterized protein LOC116663695 isoform X2 n=1 Tax=Camelus ferus TaxID=419612 RepID=A0A8B8T0I3_CAMFR|nr:uncharacterized protein LOC116663695 isoform X2 [Camelus ferus]